MGAAPRLPLLQVLLSLHQPQHHGHGSSPGCAVCHPLVRFHQRKRRHGHPAPLPPPARYPDDVEDFYANMIQMEGKAGDVVVFAGAIQHCAMPNRSKGLRTGMLQHMVPVYIKPFEAMSDYVREEIKARATPAMKRILALDHPYPVLKM